MEHHEPAAEPDKDEKIIIGDLKKVERFKRYCAKEMSADPALSTMKDSNFKKTLRCRCTTGVGLCENAAEPGGIRCHPCQGQTAFACRCGCDGCAFDGTCPTNQKVPADGWEEVVESTNDVSEAKVGLQVEHLLRQLTKNKAGDAQVNSNFDHEGAVPLVVQTVGRCCSRGCGSAGPEWLMQVVDFCLACPRCAALFGDQPRSRAEGFPRRSGSSLMGKKDYSYYEVRLHGHGTNGLTIAFDWTLNRHSPMSVVGGDRCFSLEIGGLQPSAEVEILTKWMNGDNIYVKKLAMTSECLSMLAQLVRFTAWRFVGTNQAEYTGKPSLSFCPFMPSVLSLRPNQETVSRSSRRCLCPCMAGVAISRMLCMWSLVL